VEPVRHIEIGAFFPPFYWAFICFFRLQIFTKI
jgi:hypothetical protein